MRRYGKVVLAAVLIGQASSAAVRAMDDIVLSLPQPLKAGGALILEITVGPLRRQRLLVSTAGGKYLGSIAPFGVAANRAGSTYTIPVPADLVQNGRLILHLNVTDGNGSRAPTSDEVTSMKLVLPPGE